MKVKAVIEMGKDGWYSIYLDNDELKFGLLGCGSTIDEAIKDFYECNDEMKELEEADGREYPQLEFEFIYDTASFLRYYNDIISLTGLQKLTGINRKQLSHYVTGYRKPSATTVKRIQAGIQNFSKELGSIVLR